MQKYTIGTKVRCFRKEDENWYGFDCVGIITNARTDLPFEDWEYAIDDCPYLVWESEIIEVVK